MAQTQRQYDIVVLGANGYTAAIATEYIAKSLPTDLKWAVAGRSEKKLESLLEKLKGLNADRLPPGLEIVGLEQELLDDLAKRTRLIINGIGPYHLYSSSVVEACAKAGTHYVGFSLETPWVEEMIKKFDPIAKQTGSIIIPTIALAPSDLATYLVAKTISEQGSSTGTGEVNSTVKLELQGMSAGSLNTVMSLMSSYGIGWIFPGNPWSLTLKKKPEGVSSKISFLSRLFGYRNIPGLGVGTTSFLAICNESVAHRSAALLPEIYGPNFHLHEFLPVPNFFSAFLVHFLTSFGLFVLAIPPLRALLGLLIPAGGTGPDLANAHTERQTFRAVGSPAKGEGKKVEALFKWEGSLYICSAAMGVEAAQSILGNERVPAHKIGGGILTPATLGMPFVERVKNLGATIEAKDIL